MVYAIQIDQMIALELAAISGGGEMSPGDMVDKFDNWLHEEPAPVDVKKAQLLAALGVGP